MSNFIPVAKTILLEVVQQLFGQVLETTFHWETDATIDQSLLNSLLVALHTWFAGTLCTHLSSQLTGGNYRATDLSSNDGISAAYSPEVVSGAVTESTGLPGNVALVITSRTASRGRSFRGRNYLAGIPATYLASGDGDSITLAHVADYLGDFMDLVSGMAAADPLGHLVVVSRQFDGVKRTAGVATPITAFTANDQLDAQRRRLKGRGA